MINLKCTFLLSSLILCSTHSSAQQEKVDSLQFISEDIIIQNNEEKIELGGTITYPNKSDMQYPAVILLSGSGPQDRNSELAGHKPFLSIANHLTERDIVVLRMDDRGVGESTGSKNVSFGNLLSDVNIMLDYLKKQDFVDSDNIGLIGHSLGGIIAPMAAIDHPDKVNFIITLAGPSITGKELMLLQKQTVETKMGIDEETVKSGNKKISGAYDLMLVETDISILREKLTTYFQDNYKDEIPEAFISTVIDQLTTPWFIEFIRSNPKKTIENLNCPALFIYGDSDVQVPAKENSNSILEIAQHKNNIKAVTLAKHNHLFQISETGLPTEYATIKEGISNEALELITSWILEITKTSAKYHSEKN
ncbi:MAG: alpha/beta hydrolase [Fulvivirga sp.]|uniref:alpha/beta hydrolase family protein n=1 Tax=Fulvivirga sp. TaxID=1931237 RepID=UPI0032EEBEBF